MSLYVAMKRLGFSVIHGGLENHQKIADALKNNDLPLANIDPDVQVFIDLDIIKDNFILLDKTYPQSGFILQTRNREMWFQSRLAHYDDYLRDKDRPRRKYKDGWRWTQESPDQWLKEWDMHHRAAKQYFAGRDNFMIMDVCEGDGYEKLCSFLGLANVDEPFPHKNKTQKSQVPSAAQPSDPCYTLKEQSALSCIVDDKPEIWSSITPWVLSAVSLGEFSPGRIIIHHVCSLRDDVSELCARLGVQTRRVDPFDPRSPHCNKIQQLMTDFSNAEHIVLTDVDMAFSAPLPLHELRKPIAGKLVDLPNPPLAILEEIYRDAGLPVRQVISTTGYQDGIAFPFETIAGNFNGGLYIIEACYAADLYERWGHWARWLLDRIHLLSNWKVHVDQVSFSMAVAEMNLSMDILDAKWNFPAHLKFMPYDQEPYLLHHHALLDDHQLLLDKETAPDVRNAICRVNDTLRRYYRQYFNNSTFWNHRYAHHPTAGSGLGSRNEILKAKQEMLKLAIPENTSILDWGCGDLEVQREMPYHNYCGIDVSIEAINIARSKRPDWHFATPSEFLANDGAPRDIVVCLDVLIHQRTRADYCSTVKQVLDLAKKGAIISGYDYDPSCASHITYYHEPLKETLSNVTEVVHVIPLLKYRDTQTYFVLKKEIQQAERWQRFLADNLEVPLLAIRLFLSGIAPHYLKIPLVIKETITPFGTFASLADDLITSQLTEFGAHTRNELSMVKNFVRDGDHILDIGAHIGTYAIPLAEAAGASACVHAFEADQLNAEFLAYNVHKNGLSRKITVNHCIVWDEKGHMSLSQGNIANTGSYHVTMESNCDMRLKSIETLIIDQFIDDCYSDNTFEINMIKIDVEGAEMRALQSCRRTIERYHPILYIEINKKSLEKMGSCASELEEYLLARGYRFFRNAGCRNSSNDNFNLEPVTSFDNLVDLDLWDVLAIHRSSPRYPAVDVGSVKSHTTQCEWNSENKFRQRFGHFYNKLRQYRGGKGK